MSLEAELRHISSSSSRGGRVGGSFPTSVAAIHQSFLQSELDSEEELSELIGQSTCFSVACHLRRFN